MAVYVVEAGPFVKIGYTIKVAGVSARLRYMQTDCPYKIALRFVLAPVGSRLESRLHILLEDHRAQGEWFRLEPFVEYVLKGLHERQLDADALYAFVLAEQAKKDVAETVAGLQNLKDAA